MPVRRAAASRESPCLRRALSRVPPLRSSGLSSYESYALITLFSLAFVPEGFDRRYPGGPHGRNDGEKERRHPNAGADEDHLRPREDELGIRVFYDDAEQVIAAQSTDGHAEHDT